MRLALALACFSAGAVALRRQERAATRDPWVDFANALETPTGEFEDEGPAFTSDGDPVFDWRAWRDEFEEKTFEQQADHTNAYHQQLAFLNASTTTFPQTYHINSRAWAGAAAKAPIFVIILAYGGFNAFAYGHIGEMAQEMGAMVVQIEGRFAPKSLPFNDTGFAKQANRIGLASSENAMRDYVMLISHLRDTYDPDWVCPVGTFGTSLDGNYAAWLRYKFPNVVDFALASGSPMMNTPGIADPLAYSRTITETWLDASGDPSCIPLVRDSFRALEGQECYWSFWGMISFESNYGAYPPRGHIADACQRAHAKRDAGGSPIEVALEMCGERCQDCTPNPSEPTMWGYLSCTQVINPIGNDGVSDFFWPPRPWRTSDRANFCLRDWQVEPQKEGNYHADLFGWHRLPQLADSTKRILFAYGTYDAWTGLALSKTDISADLPVVMIKGGCHGSDNIGRRENDTDAMLEARRIEAGHVARWVAAVQARPAAIDA